MIWRGVHPITIGKTDDEGNTITKFTIHPGEKIPEEARELLRATDPMLINDKGKFSESLVKDTFIKQVKQ